jgi:spore coat polysaccharide biosynthesis protein SpsF
MEVGQLNNIRIAFIIQARMQSTRLPGKILLPMPIGTQFTLLGQIINSLKLSKVNASIFIATSLNNENDILENIAKVNEVNCYRGSENDVLSRFINILEMNTFDVIVRLTADNPIIDIEIMDKTIEFHCISNKDYTNTVGLPLGMNFEVIKADALLSLKNKILSQEDREHVTLYLKNSKEYSCQTSFIDLKEDCKNARVTIDYPSDYLVVSSLFSLHLETNIPLGIEIINYANTKFPFLLNSNKTNVQKANYQTLEEEIDKVIPVLEELEFKKVVSLLQIKKQK